MKVRCQVVCLKQRPLYLHRRRVVRNQKSIFSCDGEEKKVPIGGWSLMFQELIFFIFYFYFLINQNKSLLVLHGGSILLNDNYLVEIYL